MHGVAEISAQALFVYNLHHLRPASNMQHHITVTHQSVSSAKQGVANGLWCDSSQTMFAMAGDG